MGSLLNFVFQKNFIGNGKDFLCEKYPHAQFHTTTITEIAEKKFIPNEVFVDGENNKLNINDLVSSTLNYNIDENSKNIILYEIPDLNKLFYDDFCLLNQIIEDLPKNLYKYFNENKLKILISNIGEASEVDESFFKKFEDYIKLKGLNNNNFIFIDGNCNLLEKNINFQFYSPYHFLTIIPNFGSVNDLKYVSSIPEIDEAKLNLKRNKHFLCYNRAERTHRGILLTHILKNNLFDKFYVSALRPFEITVNYSDYRFKKYKDYVQKVNQLIPIEIDTQKYEDRSLDFWTGNAFHKKFYLDSYFHICTETFFYEKDSTFFTEKILKPILGLQPFIVLSTHQYLKRLRNLGFKTFSDIFDESYDEIEDPNDRLVSILNLIDEISSWDLETCEKKYKSVLDICIYNYNHLYDNIKDDYEIYKTLKNIHDEW